MRWSYKTEHFSLKKEGLLGSAFLDEAEIEISLNEFGKAGWELVSFMEVNDGIIAVFKQPFGLGLPEEIVKEQVPDTVADTPQSHIVATYKEEEKKVPNTGDEDIGGIRIL